jgi:hypothetical protein
MDSSKLASAHPEAEPHEVVEDEEWLVSSEIAGAARSAELLWRQASVKAIVSSGPDVIESLLTHYDSTHSRLSDAREGKLSSLDDVERKQLYQAMRNEGQNPPT